MVVAATVLGGFALTIAVLSAWTGDAQHEAANAYAGELAARQASEVSADIESGFQVLRTLAVSVDSVRTDGGANRALVEALVKNTLGANPAFVDVFTFWQPDAFDGRDAELAGRPGGNEHGRLALAAVHAGGAVTVQPMTVSDLALDASQAPLRRARETLSEPYRYRLGGKDVLLAALTVPILRGGKVIGVVGADISLTRFQERISRIRPYGSGYASLISAGGVYVGDGDPDKVGRPFGSSFAAIASQAAAAGKHVDAVHDSRIGAAVTRYFLPVLTGATGTPWTLAVTLPDERVLADVRRLRVVSGALGLACVLLVSFALSLALDRLVLRPLGGEPADAAGLALRIASGDLSGVVPVKRGDDASMLYAMDTMQRQLVRMISEVRKGSGFVSSASAEIAQGNADLSRRTNEQAASLQETAAAVEQLTQAILHNVHNAGQASTLAATATGAASRAQGAVDEVVATMLALRRESTRMVEIIALIENIAFQTNILALNAAVEAARAGEQGRGFAVVAGEVRNLAQDCARAASEIGQLINGSLAVMDRGAALAERAGSTMDEVGDAVLNVRTLVDGIAAASREQGEGITQVNGAVAYLDEVTQQNAALVEQAAAAAFSLDEQAGLLLGAVRVFRTEGAPPVPALRAQLAPPR
jgi:methyl-accepting chemotaxis protein